MIVVKVPTAYMVPPHCAICRICSFGLLFGGRCGTFATGVEDTGPVGAAVAKDGAANPARPTATAAAATPARPQYLKLLCPMAHPRFPGQFLLRVCAVQWHLIAETAICLDDLRVSAAGCRTGAQTVAARWQRKRHAC